MVYAPRHASNCHVLGGPDGHGLLVQLLLGAVAFATLWLKRQRELPRRPIAVFARDSSKQAIGQLWAHALNMAVAVVLGSRGGSDMEDQCAFYFANYVVDVVFGVAFNVGCVVLAGRLAERSGYAELLRSGYYGDPPDMRRWWLQLAVWIVIVTLVKLVLLVCVLIPASALLYDASAFVLAWTMTSPDLELVVVMVIVPFVFNVAQFWVQDNFLMLSDDRTGDGSRLGHGSDGAGISWLLAGDDDDDYYDESDDNPLLLTV